jgi:hypothetical protein
MVGVFLPLKSYENTMGEKNPYRTNNPIVFCWDN